jgi:hypothetical protein
MLGLTQTEETPVRALNRLVPLAAAALLAAACGSTVPIAQQQSTLSGLGDTSTSPTVDGGQAQGTTGATSVLPGAASGSGGSSPSGSTGTASSTGAASRPSTTGSNATVQGPAATGTLAATGRGWDAKTVSIGLLTQKDFQKTFASVGYSGIDPGDTQAQAQAVLDDVNSHGGVFGRKLVIRAFDVPTLGSAQNPDSYAQQACDYFRQDAPVVAVVNIVHTMDNTAFRTCFAKNRIPLFNGAISVLAAADAARLSPYFFSLATPAWDSLAPVLIARLKAQGYFGGWDTRLSKPSTAAPVVGVLVSDTPLGHADEAVITKSLRAAGYSKVVTYAYPPPGSDIDGAVLNFAQNGATHVISDDVELVTFQIHAQSQKYAPRYGIHTYNAPSTNLEPLGPPSQQIGEVGVGWGPTLDTSSAHDPGVFGPGVSTCRALMAKNHVTSSDRLAEAFAMIVCDAVRLSVKGMVEGKGLDGLSISAGAARAGAGFSSGFSFASGLSPDRPFLPSAVRDLAWDTGCSCMQYVGSTTTRM